MVQGSEKWGVKEGEWQREEKGDWECMCAGVCGNFTGISLCRLCREGFCAELAFVWVLNKESKQLGEFVGTVGEKHGISEALQEVPCGQKHVIQEE